MADSWQIHGEFMANSWRTHGGLMADSCRMGLMINGFCLQKLITFLDMRNGNKGGGCV
jgi:hypothetical protein